MFPQIKRPPVEVMRDRWKKNQCLTCGKDDTPERRCETCKTDEEAYIAKCAKDTVDRLLEQSKKDFAEKRAKFVAAKICMGCYAEGDYPIEGPNGIEQASFCPNCRKEFREKHERRKKLNT